MEKMMYTQPKTLRIFDRLDRIQNLKVADQIYIDDAKQEIRRLYEANQALMKKLERVASIAHFGGLAKMREYDALVEIRRTTSRYLDETITEEMHHRIITKGEQQ